MNHRCANPDESYGNRRYFCKPTYYCALKAKELNYKYKTEQNEYFQNEMNVYDDLEKMFLWNNGY